MKQNYNIPLFLDKSVTILRGIPEKMDAVMDYFSAIIRDRLLGCARGY